MNEIDKILNTFNKTVLRLKRASEKYYNLSRMNTEEADVLRAEAVSNNREAKRAITVAHKIEALIGDDSESDSESNSEEGNQQG